MSKSKKRKTFLPKEVLKRSLFFLGVLLFSCLVIVGVANSDKAQQILTSRNPILGVSPPKAFPEAEGFGAQSKGGRGGNVYIVDNTKDSGSGSLRECVEAIGARICTFSIGGTIVLSSPLEISNPYITIAGQTAPGGGITLKSSDSKQANHLHVRTHNVVIRYIRSRPGTTILNGRALSIGNGTNTIQPTNVIIDHSSFSWSGDELMISWSAANNNSYQWNIFAESLPSTENSTGLKGPNLGNDGGGYYSFHHNLVAHHTQRSPQISGSGGPTDVVNNLIYNIGGKGSVVKNGAQVNYVGNYIEAGPETRASSYVEDILNQDSVNKFTRGIFVRDNFVEGKNIIKSFIETSTNSNPFTVAEVITTSPQLAYSQVLAVAGASAGLNCDGTWYSRRDSVDTRIVESVKNDRTSHNNPVITAGYIKSPTDVLGWPVLEAGSACIDSDQDGMPDAWEFKYFQGMGVARNPSPKVSGIATDFDKDGYTDIEEYLNGSNPRTGTEVTPTIAPYPSATPTPTPTPSATPATSPKPTVTPSSTQSPSATPPTSNSKTETIHPTADAFVKSGETKSYGKTYQLQVDTDPKTISFLKFNLENFEGKTITSVQLTFTVANGSDNKQRLRPARKSDWSEDSLTFSNMPGAITDPIRFNGGKAGEKITLNVTPLLKYKNGNEITFMIDTEQSNGFNIYSREHSSKPELTITYQ